MKKKKKKATHTRAFTRVREEKFSSFFENRDRRFERRREGTKERFRSIRSRKRDDFQERKRNLAKSSRIVVPRHRQLSSFSPSPAATTCANIFMSRRGWTRERNARLFVTKAKRRRSSSSWTTNGTPNTNSGYNSVYYNISLLQTAIFSGPA